MKGIENTIAYKKGNNYIIEGNVVKIELERRNKESLYALIDIDDYEKVKNYPFTWHSTYSKKIKGYYCVATEHYHDKDGNYKHRTYYLHIFIANPKELPNIQVDHIHHNTLDDRKENLRVTNRNDNYTNRNGKNSNNKSGYRNVFWNNAISKWSVRLCKNYKSIHIGDYDDVDEAGRVAENARKQYYGDYAGIN